MIDEFLCVVAGCALGTDVCHWMLNKIQRGSRSTRFSFKWLIRTLGIFLFFF